LTQRRRWTKVGRHATWADEAPGSVGVADRPTVGLWNDACVQRPSGTVSFLFSDIEGSTRLWQVDEEAMRAAVALHDELLHGVVAEQGGVVFSTMGDGLAAAFPTASAGAPNPP